MNLAVLKPLVSRDKAVFHSSIIRTTFPFYVDRTSSLSCEQLSDPREQRL